MIFVKNFKNYFRGHIWMIVIIKEFVKKNKKPFRVIARKGLWYRSLRIRGREAERMNRLDLDLSRR